MSDFNPMKAKITDGNVPHGTYSAVFKIALHLPVSEGDMEGKGKRLYEAVRFTWEITTDGDYKGKCVSVETTVKNGSQSRQYTVVSWLLGKQPTTEYDLSPCVGKKYLITVGSKQNSKWTEITNAMLSPQQ